LRARVDDWRGLLRRHVPQARQILRKLFPKPLLLGPDEEGFALRGQASIEKLVTGLPCANVVASPAGFEPAVPACEAGVPGLWARGHGGVHGRGPAQDKNPPL